MFAAIMLGGTRKASLQLLLLHVVVFLVCAKNTCVVVDAADIKCIEKERRALLMIKKDLEDEYDHLSSWGDQEDCCNNWRGIKCNNQTLHVTKLDLRVSTSVGNSNYEPLRGKISHSLLELQHLTYLDLSNNDFGGGHIPAFIGSFTKLTYLNLSNAEFGGSIPYQLGNLSSLQFLDLTNHYYYNQISSENLSWLSHLSSLRYLDMSNVYLEKAVDWIQAINMLPLLVDLRLSQCSLSSTVPPLLSLLNSSSSSFSVLDLSKNYLTSEIYQWLFNFVGHSLVDLDFSDNKLEGPIPDAFESMTSLTHLDLSLNILIEGIPKSLGNLLHLKTLDISFCNLIGNLPEIVRNLYGSLPNKFEHLSKLEVLDMRYNRITGPLPDLSVFPSLRQLGLSHNQINGSLPESIGQLSNLEHLDVSSNRLQGTISEAHFSTLTNLNILDLSNNPLLILVVSSKWLPFFQLDKLRLGSCKLGPRFPVWLRTQRNMSSLDISNAGISDAIPNWFWDLGHNLEFLNMSYNNIKGILPDLSSKIYGHLSRIYLRSNHLEGPIPLFPSNTASLDLSKNRFKGPISVICSIVGGGLEYLDLSDNFLSGKLPDCWRQLERLEVLILANNQFNGKISNSIGFLTMINSLHLNHNRLTGELPSSLQNCTALVTMDVGENKLTGKLPTWIGKKLSSLIIFRLRSNEFYGSIPTQLCYLQSIQLLDISLNSITGTIPRCFNNFTSIGQKLALSETYELGHTGVWMSKGDIIFQTEESFIEYALVSWKGRIYEYGSTLGLVKSIDLSSNKLIGKIPIEITNLSGLVALNLSRNNLVGLIPLDIGQMRKLESLDLSRNRISGEIPESMSEINSLSSLDLSYNSLSGKIPSGTQLQSLAASAFTGNPKLCGPPLTEKCQGDHTNQEYAHIQEDEDEFVPDKWFYASITLGFIVGFWGVCGTLVLHRSWRHAYFQCFENSKDWLYIRITMHTARTMRKFHS